MGFTMSLDQMNIADCDDEQRQLAVQFCFRHDAQDVLPILGLEHG